MLLSLLNIIIYDFLFELKITFFFKDLSVTTVPRAQR